MPLQSFIDNSLPTIKAAWLNAVDAFYFTLFNSATTAAQARTAIGAASAASPTLTGTITVTTGLTIASTASATTISSASTSGIFILTTANGATTSVSSNGVGSAAALIGGLDPAGSASVSAGTSNSGLVILESTAKLNGSTSSVLLAAGANVAVATAAGLTITGKLLGAASSLMSPITNSLSGDVALNNTANYFDGPSIAQGTSGTWWTDGTVTVTDTGAAVIFAKLWDGTTVIASAVMNCPANNSVSISLSGFLTTPAGNLRISVRDATNATGNIKFNTSGNSKDSTISAFRIA